MGLFSATKSDPLVKRQRALTAELQALQAQIRQLDSALGEGRPAENVDRPVEPAGLRAEDIEPGRRDLVFEPVNHNRVTVPAEADLNAAQFNELGVRKYDLAAVWHRFFRNFRGPPASNPKLISYLAAGSIQGLRPLRYEKRVARNRVVVLTVILGAILLGLWQVFGH